MTGRLIDHFEGMGLVHSVDISISFMDADILLSLSSCRVASVNEEF